MFDFPKVEHKNFDKNFLKTVIFQINFEKYNNLNNKSKKIGELFKDNFPRFNLGKGKSYEILLNNENTNFQQIEDGHNIIMKSENGQRIINIKENSLSFTVSGTSYKSFDNISKDLENIISFLTLCEINEITRLAIRKINIVEFKNSENPSDILRFLLNPTLINHIEKFPNGQNINHSIQSINFKKNNDFLNIKYGLNIPPQLNYEVGQLIIDIDLFQQDKIDKSSILNKSKKINSEIFNIFNWIINENAKKILNG